MITKDIYDGLSAEDIGISDIEYNSRKETLDLFLETWNGDNFKEEFKSFLSNMYKEIKEINEELKGGFIEENKYTNKEKEPDLTYGEMFSGLAKAIGVIAKNGMKTVDNETHEERFSICKDCQYLEGDRCSKCGCFMKLKSKFKGMDCPIGLW